MLETDTGIEIKIPMEEYNTKDNVEIIEDPTNKLTIDYFNNCFLNFPNQIKIPDLLRIRDFYLVI